MTEEQSERPGLGQYRFELGSSGGRGGNRSQEDRYGNRPQAGQYRNSSGGARSDVLDRTKSMLDQSQRSVNDMRSRWQPPPRDFAPRFGAANRGSEQPPRRQSSHMYDQPMRSMNDTSPFPRQQSSGHQNPSSNFAPRDLAARFGATNRGVREQLPRDHFLSALKSTAPARPPPKTSTTSFEAQFDKVRDTQSKPKSKYTPMNSNNFKGTLSKMSATKKNLEKSVRLNASDPFEAQFLEKARGMTAEEEVRRKCCPRRED